MYKDESGQPDVNVQGFLDSICDVFSCLRLHASMKRALPKDNLTPAQYEEACKIIDDANVQIEPCGIISIISLLLRVLGVISKADVVIRGEDLTNCIADFEQLMKMIQTILDAINGNANSGGCGCNPKQPNNPTDPIDGYNPAGPGNNRGC